MLAIKIDNPDIEKKFFEYAKLKKKKIEEVVTEAMREFLDKQKKDEEIVYIKKDPMKHMRKLSYKYDENLDDVKPYSHVKDSAKYIHDLRRKKS